MAVRISLLSGAIWWAAFTLIPWRGIKDKPPSAVEAGERRTAGSASFGQLWRRLKEMRNYPVAVTFLLAYLFFNDGIQTVIASAAIFGEKELGFETGVVLGAIPPGPVRRRRRRALFGRAAAAWAPRRVILVGLGLWMVIVTVALVVPEET